MATAPKQDDVIRAGPLEVHRSGGLVLAEGRAVPVSVRELGLLVALLDHRGGIVRRRDLYREVWGSDMREGDRSIDVYVHKLRAKLDDALPGRQVIHTHVGFGYRLELEPA